MPKIKRKPFGNPKLDKMQPPLPGTSWLDKDRSGRQSLINLTNMIKTLDHLCDHYRIDKDNPEKWFLLSLHLAHDYVPAMHHQKKRGKSREWEWEDELGLYALIELNKKQTKRPYRTIYYDIPDLAQGTKLARLVPKGTALKTIQNKHGSFAKGERYNLLVKLNPLFKNMKENIETIAALTIYSPDYHAEKPIKTRTK